MVAMGRLFLWEIETVNDFERRYAIGKAAERALARYYTEGGAVVSDPIDHDDGLLAGERGFLVPSSGKVGLNRDFVPKDRANDWEWQNGSPAFMTDRGPLLSPDLRVDHPDHQTRFIEVKARPYLLRAKLQGSFHETGSFMGAWPSHQAQSYQGWAEAGANLTIELLLFEGLPGREQHIPQRIRGAWCGTGSNPPKWGLWRFGPTALQNAWGRNPWENEDSWGLPLRAGRRGVDPDNLNLVRYLSCETAERGLSLFEARRGSAADVSSASKEKAPVQPHTRAQ